MSLSRRNFLRNAAGLLVAAPFVAKAESLMRIALPTVIELPLDQPLRIREVQMYDIRMDAIWHRIDVIGADIQRHASFEVASGAHRAGNFAAARELAMQRLASAYGCSVARLEALPAAPSLQYLHA